MLRLSAIVNKEVVQLIQVGMSFKVDSSLVVVEKGTEGWTEIEPFAQPLVSPFCERCRQLLDGFDDACRCSDRDCARQVYENRWEQAQGYRCHMGLREFGIVITAIDTPVAAFIAGQVALKEDLGEIQSRLRSYCRRVFGRLDSMTESTIQGLIQQIRIVSESELATIKRELENSAAIISSLASFRFRYDMIVHELNATTVMAIRGGASRMARYVARNYSRDEKLLSIAKDLDQAVDYMSYVQERDSAAARLLRGTLSPASWRMEPVRRVIHYCADLFLGEAQARFIDIQIDPRINELRSIPMNLELLRVAFGNVIGNAVKYSHAGNPERPRDILIYVDPGRKRSGFQAITIRNWGMGVTDADKEQVFRPYTRGSNYDQKRFIVGTGLGLFVAKEIIEQHGGSIEVWSELFNMPRIDPTDKQVESRAWDTSFTIWLPEGGL